MTHDLCFGLRVITLCVAAIGCEAADRPVAQDHADGGSPPLSDGAARDAGRSGDVLVGERGTTAPRVQDGPFRVNVPSTQVEFASFRVVLDAERHRFEVREPAGRVLLSNNAGQAFILASAADSRIETNNSGSIRVSFDTSLKSCLTQTVDKLEKIAGSGVRFEGQLSGSNCRARYALTLTQLSPRRLGFSVTLLPGADAAQLNLITLSHAAAADERVFGFGIQPTVLNMKGRFVPVIVQEQGHGRGLQPLSTIVNAAKPLSAGDELSSYAPMPYYLTSSRRGFFLENTEFSFFDFQDPIKVQVHVLASKLDGQLLRGESLMEIIEGYTEYAGRFAPLPTWFHDGAIFGGFLKGSKNVRQLMQRFDRLGTPLSAIWIEDWIGTKEYWPFGERLIWNWEVRDEVYPDWPVLRDEIHKRGWKVLGYVNPHLIDPSGLPGIGRNLYAEAKQQSLLVKDTSGAPYQIDLGGISPVTIDLTNPAAFAWLKQTIQTQLIDVGLDGWMADFGESLPLDGQLFSKEPAASVRNRFVELWARCNFEAVKERNKAGQAAYFLRGGFTRSPRYAQAFWLGDQLVSWDRNDGMYSALVGMLSAGLSGITIAHSDTGGLIAFNQVIVKIQRSEELMRRWTEMNAFTAVLRFHEGYNPRGGFELMSSSDATFAPFDRLMRIFYWLKDYRRQLVLEAQTLGHPVVRPLFLNYPNDPRAYAVEDQFMLGQDFVVAPVLAAGVNRRNVYLPAGTWVHLWTHQDYEAQSGGRTIDMLAELGRPPVFYRKGSPAGESLFQQLEQSKLR